MLPLSERMKVIDFIKKEKKSYAEVTEIYGKNESSSHEVVKKEKEIRAGVAVVPQTAKVTPHCLVKMEKAFNLYKIL